MVNTIAVISNLTNATAFLVAFTARPVVMTMKMLKNKDSVNKIPKCGTFSVHCDSLLL